LHIFSNNGSSFEIDDENLSAVISSQKRGKRHRRLSQTDPQSKRKRSRSRSPLIGENFQKGIDTSDNSGGSGKELSTNTPESTSDIKRDDFLWEEGMPSTSHWEEEFQEFLKHKAKLMDHYSYKGLVAAEESEDPGDSQNQLWYPYDPDNVLDTQLGSEVDEETSTDGAAGQANICYGIVSLSLTTYQLVEPKVDILKQSVDLANCPTDPQSAG
jgi:hypothetical protein